MFPFLKYSRLVFSQTLLLQLTTSLFGPLAYPSQVLNSRIGNSHAVPRVLIQWGLLDSSAVSCEDLEKIKHSFPHFNLVDKVVSNGGGIVTCEQSSNLENVKLKENTELDLEGKFVT